MTRLNTFFLALVCTLFLVACGSDNNATNNTESTDTSAEVTSDANATTEENNSSTATDTPKGAAVITDAVMESVCNCVNQSKDESGTADIAKIQECMGGKGSEQYVADLLGPGATDKEISDAQNALQDKMGEKCPIN